MNTILWICQALLCVIFLYSGVIKVSMAPAKIVSMGQTGVAGLPEKSIRLIALSELAGAVGIVLPWLLHQWPVLTPFSAVGFCIIMVCASLIHYRRGEYKTVAGNMFIFFVALLVAVLRFGQL